mmetsp:Transcript_89273/g.207749  ORF Transcript_89273/g.207749 Transcript_89273/m.207749 type:complete len:221 (-) Transcript_89273:99-761(-)
MGNVVHPVLVLLVRGVQRDCFRAHTAQDHARAHCMVDVDRIGWFLLFRNTLVHRESLQEALVRCLGEDLGKIQEVLVDCSKVLVADAAREGREVSSVHACCVSIEGSPVVTITELADYLLHLVHPVEVVVAQEAECLEDDPNICELPARCEMQGLFRETLQSVLNVFKLPVGAHQEGDITDAKAASLNDGASRPILVAVDRIVRPRVTHACQLVHRIKHL